ncbi:hypothetical protein [Helicobacter sp. T3_23-1056]
MQTIDSNPLIEIKFKIGTLRKIALIISAGFGCIVIYSFIQVLFKLDIFKAIKQEWGTILIFPFMLALAFGVYFCVREIIVGNRRKITLYDNYFIIITNKFLFTKTIKLNYGDYGIKIAHNFGFLFHFYNIMFFDINKQNPKWSDMKIKCVVHLPLFNTNTFDANMDNFMEMFQTKTEQFLHYKNINNLNNDSIK